MKMPYNFYRVFSTAAAFAGLVFLAACTGDVAGSKTNQLRLSLTTKASSSGLRGNVGVAQDIAIGATGQLVIKKIQLVMDRVELSRTGAVTCTDDGKQENDDCEELQLKPLLINVPVDDALHTLITVPVTVGTFRKLEGRIMPVDAATGATLGLPADMAGKSVRVEGTFNGTPFVYTSALRTHLEFEFVPPLAVDGVTSKNATVNIDVRKWFLTSGGAVIDPATANAAGPNAELVAKNIRKSIRAFEDDELKGDNGKNDGENEGIDD